MTGVISYFPRKIYISFKILLFEHHGLFLPCNSIKIKNKFPASITLLPNPELILITKLRIKLFKMEVPFSSQLHHALN